VGSIFKAVPETSSNLYFSISAFKHMVDVYLRIGTIITVINQRETIGGFNSQNNGRTAGTFNNIYIFGNNIFFLQKIQKKITHFIFANTCQQ
jgi:hypothetical protein